MKRVILLLIVGALLTDTFAQNYCGVRSSNYISPRVLGEEAREGEFPWMAAVFSEKAMVNNQPQLEYKCGASIIHPQVLLTVAHCVDDSQKTYHIKAGMLDVQTEDGESGTQQRRVNSVVVHPRFNKQTLEYDVAILILNSPLMLSENVNTVCLPVSDLGDREDKICHVSGWGKDKFGGSGKLQTVLRKVELSLVPSRQCQTRIRNKLKRMYQLPSSLICAGGEQGKDTCQGDGGSALVCTLPDHTDTYYEIGFVVAGIGCGEDNTPGLYANILQFKDWIDQQFDNNKFEKTYDIF